ncbi:MAG: bifunctional aspartate kinase/homoserine dehydrogenase I, partial [Ktedonobacterales bacterium]
IRIIGEIVRRAQQRAGDAVVVVSAFHGVTDQLIALARGAATRQPEADQLADLETRHLDAVRALLPPTAQERALDEARSLLRDLRDLLRGVALTGELTPCVQDAVMSFGEALSAQIIAAYLATVGVDAEYLDMRRLLRTDSRFGSAHVEEDVTYPAIQRHFATHPALQIATGFIGATAAGQTTTLGRGGSDYTAALLGAALDVEEIEIWTDVNGVYTADPRAVDDAFPLAVLTYEEAMELAHFGAKVIYPPTIQPALSRRIPLRVKNTFAATEPGTIIAERRPPSAYPIAGLTSISAVDLLLVRGSGMIGAAGVAMRLFGALARNHINVILITQASSEHTICLAVAPIDAEPALLRIEEEFALELRVGQLDAVEIRHDCAIIAAVGEGMRERPGISGALFSALGRRHINVVAIAQGSSELNISVVVARRDEAPALRALHEAFFAPDRGDIHIFLVGVGLIGGALLRQMMEQAERLRAENGVRLHLRGLASTRSMLIEAGGDIALSGWRERLDGDGEPADITAFVERMVALRLPNSVCVDCTASDAVPARYVDALRAGITVVTANKRGLTGPYSQYVAQRRAAAEGRAAYLYETTVGAALPVLAPLRDLLATGDTILTVEAALSGTMNFLFSTFDGSRPFSAVVRDAREAGYTEPDPRDDLSGADVARKLLILARECGHPLELADVRAAPLLSDRCHDAASVEAFFSAPRVEDDHYERLRAEAASVGRVLRYIARLDGDRATAGLEAVDMDHPFAKLAGSENIIAFTTARYREQPLVVRGPGAGAEVTAAGVFADILRSGRGAG